MSLTGFEPETPNKLNEPTMILLWVLLKRGNHYIQTFIFLQFFPFKIHTLIAYSEF